MKLEPLPAFTDNYIWLVHDDRSAVVVDPGDAQVVQQALAERSLRLQGILVTHHHPDHTGGVAQLRESTGATVWGPATERIPQPFEPLRGGQHLGVLGLDFEVIDVPGHTAGHIAFWCAAFEGRPLLFCGDTLFSGGCGRLFEGTPAQMLASLSRLAALPGDTRVCCTHEYTLSNLRFARAVEPANAALADYERACQERRARGEPTLPSSLTLELQINPFLRWREDAVRAAAAARDAQAHDDVAVFAAIRQWKNEFK